MIYLNKILLEKIVRSLSRILFWLARRVLVLYLIGGVLFVGLVSHTKVLSKAKIGALNRLIPTPEYLFDFTKSHGEFDNKKLREYTHYHRKLVRCMPWRWDAQAMLGYCLYYGGKYDKAVSAYQKAAKINPHYFWNHYNLGISCFRAGRYREAVQSFQKALEIDLNATLPILNAAQVLRPLLSLEPMDRLEPLVRSNVKRGRLNCFRLLILSHFYLNDMSQAIRLATDAIAANLGDAEFFYYYAGLSAYKLGQFGTAASFFQKCITSNPRNADALHYVGMALKMLKNEQMADKFLQQAKLLGYQDGHEMMAFDKMMELEIY